MLRIASLTTAAFLAAGAAYAAPIEARIPYGDLDLSSRAGATEFDARIGRAADLFCRSVRAVERPFCRNGVRQEALSLLPDRARTDYARGRFAFQA